MLSILFFSQLMLIALVWLFLMLSWLGPNHSAADCQANANPATPRRERQ